MHRPEHCVGNIEEKLRLPGTGLHSEVREDAENEGSLQATIAVEYK